METALVTLLDDPRRDLDKESACPNSLPEVFNTIDHGILPGSMSDDLGLSWTVLYWFHSSVGKLSEGIAGRVLFTLAPEMWGVSGVDSVLHAVNSCDTSWKIKAVLSLGGPSYIQAQSL